MMTCLKYLLPISCFLLLGVSVWQVWLMPVINPYFQWALGAACLVGLAAMFVKLVTTRSHLPGTGVGSPWGPMGPPPGERRALAR
jgi:hypothetical protein